MSITLCSVNVLACGGGGCLWRGWEIYLPFGQVRELSIALCYHSRSLHVAVPDVCGVGRLIDNGRAFACIRMFC